MPSQSRNNASWTYEVLPYLYLGAGVLVLLGLRNLWGAFSGMLLISAGVIVWNMRRRHRRLSRMRADQRLWKAQQRNEALQKSRFVELVWRSEYECGNPAIDAQHRKLFAHGNALLNAIMGDETKLDVELKFDELIEKVAHHFKAEEAVLKLEKNPSMQAHKVAHDELLLRCKELAERYHRDELDAGDLFNFMARDVLAQHILKDDLKQL
jgi:hemerythrin-like metal-binding protein